MNYEVSFMPQNQCHNQRRFILVTLTQQQFAYKEIIKPWLLPPQMHFAAVSDSPNLDSHLCDIVPWQVLLLMN